ncbi:MAG: NAD(P)H-hydrate dehydratase, partial [Flavobacteriales bacterium]
LQSDALIIVNSAADLPTVLSGTIVLDALFGTGLNRALDGLAQKAVNWMNRSNAPVVAIDLPSGLFADGSVMDPNGIVQAQHTLTFHCPKPAFYYRECAQFLGEWTVLDIGLDDAFIDRLNSEYKEVGSDDVRRLLPAFHRFAHKGDHGHVLLIAGSEGMMGAAALAVMSALRSGVGLVTVHIPKIGLQVLQSLAPEALCSVDNGEARIADLPDLSRCSAVGIGPGMGAGSASVVELLIQKARMPLVLDADALNALAENKTWLANLPKGTVLTPHPKEFDRLFGAHSSGRERIATAKDEARKRAIVIVLKGAYTAICAASGQVFFNPTGDPGMAKGGSGDVLTGLITGLLARGLQPLEAALLGTYVHGTAGTLAAVHVGRDGMTAIDIIHHLPMAWRELRRGASENAVQ